LVDAASAANSLLRCFLPAKREIIEGERRGSRATAGEAGAVGAMPALGNALVDLEP